MARVDKLPVNPTITKVVKEMTKNGVPVATIFSAIQKYQDAPGSLSTFYKNYRTAMEEARAENVSLVGSKVLNAALNGPEDSGNTFKARELYLRTQGGWSPKETVETRDVGTDEEEDQSAVESLMTALGMGSSDDV